MTTKQKIAINSAYFSIISNLLLAFVKGSTGLLGHSYALIADAIESTTDVFSSILVLLGLKIAHKPPDNNHPYGHGKVEPLLTFMVVAFLVTSATIIAIQSLHNIQTPHESPKAWTLMILTLIIGWKEFSFRLVMRKAKATNSSALKADAWHHRSDAITSMAAFIGIVIAVLMGEGYENIDDYAALIAAIVILYNSYHIFRPALGELMDEHLYDDFAKHIKAQAQHVDGICRITHCLIRKSGIYYSIDIEATVDGNLTVTQGHDLATTLEKYLLTQFPEILTIIIHIEPDDC